MEDHANLFEDINFEALWEVDREIDVAIEHGEWSQERFRLLYERGLSATSGHKEPLAFLFEVGEAGWSADGIECAGQRRLPRQVRELIRRLTDGWEPSLTLPKGISLLWNEQPVAVTSVEVVVQTDKVSVIAALRSETRSQVQAFTDRRGLVRDTLHVEFPYGWRLDSSVAVLTERRSEYSESGLKQSYVYLTRNTHISRGEQEPNLWIIPFDTNITLPSLKNIIYQRNTFSYAGKSASDGDVGLRGLGAFPYVMLQVNSGTVERKKTFLIIEVQESGFDDHLVETDLLALQFSLGGILTTSLAYGIWKDNVVAVRQVLQRQGNQAPTQTTPPVPNTYDRHSNFIEFFEQLSSSMRKRDGAVLSAVSQLFLRSFDALIDTSIRELVAGIAVLLNSCDWPLVGSLSNRVKDYFALYQIKLPDDIARNLNYISNQLTDRGVISLNSDEKEIEKLIRHRNEFRTLLVAMLCLKIGYTGPIIEYHFEELTPSWWPARIDKSDMIRWSATLPPEDGTYGRKSGEVLIIVERPEYIQIMLCLLKAARLPSERLRFASTDGKTGLRRKIGHIASTKGGIVLVADSSRNHMPSAIDGIRSDLSLPDSSHISICPAVPCMDAWLLADDDLVRPLAIDGGIQPRVWESLPEELPDAKVLAQQIFGPPELWNSLPTPDIFRAAERSPSLRRFLGVIAAALNVKLDLPAQSVSRAISRSAIAGLIRDLLDKDAIAWRTSDEGSFTAEALAREVEQGTELGRQYTVDLVSMMINTLSRKARHRG